MTGSSIYYEYQELLVKPLDRVGFITKFWLITVVGDLILLYLCNFFAPLLYIQNNFVGSNIAELITGSIIGLLIGTVSGLLQYFWLRQYFVREWIIANSVSYVFYGVYVLLVFLWSIHFSQGQTYDVHPVWLTIYNLFFPFLLTALSLVQGCMQWLVFKTYLKKVNWWIWFPLITSYCSELRILPFTLLLWFPLRKNLTNAKRFVCYLLAVKGFILIIYNQVIREMLFDSKNGLLINLGIIINSLESWFTFGGLIDGLGFWYAWITGILAFNAIQAIAICYLRKRKKDPVLYVNNKSFFAGTANSTNYWQTRSTIRKLEQKIDSIWKEELNTRFPLTYWLAVKNNSEIIACHPLNQVSQDNFLATPLSQLISELTLTETITTKLQITFNYPGVVDIRSLSGIPLYLIAISLLSIIIVFSLLVTHAIVLPLAIRLS